MSKIKLFYSYSQEDEKFRDKLEKSLVMLHRYDDIQEWHFRKISPGEEWDNKINKELASSDIILLLVSIDFLASHYCFDVEVKKAMEMHENKEAIVVPIILRECDWKHSKSPFNKLQGLPKNGQPINLWDDIDTAFNDVTQRLKETVEEIKQKKLSKKETNTSEVSISKLEDGEKYVDNNSLETLTEAVRLIKLEINKLDYDSPKEDFERVQKLRSKLYDELIGKLDEKIENIPALKKNIPSTLFDRIYVSEKLDSITIQDIQSIRDRKATYSWYERKVIINSLTLSLICSKIFDPKKANLLIDFLTDFEERVWESALIGLVISLVYHQNKWIRFNDLKIRLQTLQEIEKVQNGIGIIEVIFRYKLYSKSIFDESIYKSPFFASTLNCFLPFYEDNPILENAIQNNSTEVDSDDFIKYINDLPFLDSHKYALCLAIKNDTIVQRKISNDERVMLQQHIDLSLNFEPYQNLICEYYNFLNFYPQKNISNIFSNHFSIARTKLKDLILNKKNELELSANILMDEKEYRDAMSKLSQLLKIEPNNIIANSKIARCYISLKKPDYYSALIHLKNIEKIEPNNLPALINIVECYLGLKNNPKALEYIQKAKLKYSKNKDVILIECLYYENCKEYLKVIEIAQEAERIYINDYIFPFSIANAYEELESYKLAIQYFLKALKLSPSIQLVKIYRSISSAYCYDMNFDKALEYSIKAYELDRKDGKSLMTLGRTYLFGRFDIKLARKYLETSLSKESLAVIYGNLGHLELCEGNLKKSVEYYKKCILGFENVTDFSEKFDKDLYLILSYNVTKDQYVQVKEQVIASFLEKK